MAGVGPTGVNDIHNLDIHNLVNLLADVHTFVSTWSGQRNERAVLIFM